MLADAPAHFSQKSLRVKKEKTGKAAYMEDYCSHLRGGRQALSFTLFNTLSSASSAGLRMYFRW